MSRREDLAHTLIALLHALEGDDAPGQGRVTDAEVTVPMEVSLVDRGGALTLTAAPPASAWVSGFMAPISRVHLRAGQVETPAPDREVGS